MKYLYKKILAILLCAATLFSLATAVFCADEKESATTVTVLFTHDLHSHLLPSVAEDGGEYGGYARIMHVIKKEKAKDPNAILVDAGDFSMGSLFQTAFPTSAIELRIMGEMGYDATTLGNHEFDYLPSGLASMLNAAVDSGDRLPSIVASNYVLPEKGEDGYNEDLSEAFKNYGVREYVIIERGGIYFAIFGMFGLDADDCAPNSGMKLLDSAKTAQATVDKARKECLDKYGKEPVVVCLSHSGTEKREGEDYELAKNTEGIDVIVSGHTHSTLQEPVIVNGTHIVSGAEYGKYVGILKLDFESDGTANLNSYKLVSINEYISSDKAISKKVEEYKATVEKEYLSKYGVSYDEVLINNDVRFETVKEAKATQHESTVCNLFSDAYKWAVEKASGKPVDVALTAAGVVRESLPYGPITTSDVFNAASLGVGTEGELIAVYVTGADLKNALEVDASVQPLMKSAQLYFSGIEYSYNQNRMIFNKVDYAALRNADGTTSEIDDEKLYRVVTGMYAGQMLGSVEETSMGILKITPRDSEGNPIPADKLSEHVVRDEKGNPVKEWYAIASYLQSMDGKMDTRYSEPDGRKVVYKSLNPVKLLSGANMFTYILLAVIAVLMAVIVLVTVVVVKKIKKRKALKA